LSNLKNTNTGIASFVLMLMVVIYVLYIAILDIAFFDEATMSTWSLNIPQGVEILILTGVSFVSFVLGIVARFQKESKKVLPTIAIIVSGVFVAPAITGLIKNINISLILR
jgi:hypothetical protein